MEASHKDTLLHYDGNPRTLIPVKNEIVEEYAIFTLRYLRRMCRRADSWYSIE